MPRAARMFIRSLLFLTVLTAACSRHGSEFVGKWINTTNPCDKFEITRNGQQFLLGKVPATYKDDGTLQAPYALGTITVAYIKSSDTLALVATGPSGQQEYKRDLSQEPKPASSSDFVGKWATVGNDPDTLELSRNGEQFLMSYSHTFGFAERRTDKYALIYKDGSLRTRGYTLTYAGCSDTVDLRAVDARQLVHIDMGVFKRVK